MKLFTGVWVFTLPCHISLVDSDRNLLRLFISFMWSIIANHQIYKWSWVCVWDDNLKEQQSLKQSTWFAHVSEKKKKTVYFCYISGLLWTTPALLKLCPLSTHYSPELYSFLTESQASYRSSLIAKGSNHRCRPLVFSEILWYKKLNSEVDGDSLSQN